MLAGRSRSKLPRDCKEISSRIQGNLSDNSDSEFEEESLVSNKPSKTIARKQNVQINKLAILRELNLKHQYEERIKYCDRETLKIDEKGGSKDESKKYVKVLVNAGMFEVLKKGLVKELEKMFNVKINENKQAKVDVYGKDEAEIKYHIYFIFSLDSNVYKAKLDVYNTTCSIGIDSIGTGSENTRLGGMTIAEYIFHTFLKNIA